MLLRVILIALYSVHLSVCQRDKIFRGSSVRARIFSGGFLYLFKTSRNGCENQSKKIHVLFAISEPLLEYGTIQKSSEKYIQRFS